MARAFRVADNREAVRELLWKWVSPAALVVLTLPAVLPLARVGFPVTDDAVFHVSRMLELQGALATGQVYPRWVEPFVQGLGFPFFDFYGPIPYYLALTLSVTGLTHSDAFKLLCMLIPPSAALAVYWWTVTILGRAQAHGCLRYLPALGAGVAYGYVPHLLVDVHLRGAPAEGLAMVLLPVALYAFDQIRWRPRLESATLAGLTLGALILTHNPMALIGSGVIAAYVSFWLLVGPVALSGRVQPTDETNRQLLCIAVAATLGLGISAFHWVPAVLERDYLSFTFNWLKTDYFAADTRLKDSWPPIQSSFLFDFAAESRFRVGAVQMLLAMTGLLPLGALIGRAFRWRGVTRLASGPTGGGEQSVGQTSSSALALMASPAGDSDRVASASFLGALSAFCAFGMVLVVLLLSPASAPIWREVPLLDSMQFPWRMLGAMAVFTATLSGLGLWWLGARWSRALPVIAGAFVAVVIGSSTIGLPTELGPAPVLDAGTIHRVTSLSGWTFPKESATVYTAPEDVLSLSSFRMRKQEPGRLSLELEASRATTVVLHVLDFPGWNVYVDGSPTLLSSDALGRVGFPLPEGRHSVLVQFENTPLRTAAEALSAASVVALLAVLGFLLMRRRQVMPAIVGTALLTIIFIAPRLDAKPAPDMEFYQSALPPSNAIRLLGVGVDRPRERVFGLTLFWQALEPQDELETFVALVDGEGNAVGNPAHLTMSGAYTTGSWQRGEIIPDRVELEIPPGFTTSQLELRAGFRPYDPNHRATPVASFRLPLYGKEVAAPSIQGQAELGGVLRLETCDLERRVFAAGGRVPVDLVWQALDQVPFDTGVYLHLVDSDGRMWAQYDGQPGPDGYPAFLWSDGERIRERRELLIPSDAPPGRYELRLGGYAYPDLRELSVVVGGAASREHSVSVGDVFVVASDTRRSEAHPSNALRAVFSDQVELVGFDLSSEELRPGQGVTVTTYWRALQPIPTGYTMFAHLVDSSGGLRGQSDGQPAGGSYPTSLWQTDEYIVDRRVITLDPDAPAGIYGLAVGLYEWPSLNRLAAAVDGTETDGAVELGSVRVVSAPSE